MPACITYMAAAGTRVSYYPGSFFYPTLPGYPNSKNYRVCPCNSCLTKTRTFSFNNRLYLCSSVEFVSIRKNDDTVSLPM